VRPFYHRRDVGRSDRGTRDSCAAHAPIPGHSNPNTRTPLANLTIAPVVLCVVVLVASLASIFSSKTDSLKRTGAVYDSETILKRTKPFYIDSEDWSEIRKIACQHFVPDETIFRAADLENSLVYRKANQEKPDFLSNEEWGNVRMIASERFLSVMVRLMESSYKTADLFTLLKINKPVQVPAAKWSDFYLALQKQYLSVRLQERFREVPTRLNETRPDEIGQSLWDENQEELGNRYSEDICSRLEYDEAPFAYIGKFDLKVLPEERAAKIRNRAYDAELRRLPELWYVEDAKKFLAMQRPTWIKDKDYDRLKTKAEQIGESEKQRKTNESVQFCLDRIISGEAIDEDVIGKLDPSMQKKLNKLDEAIRRASKDIASGREKLDQELKQLTLDRAIVIKQLNILGQLFADPTSIDRLEAYDNPFAPGNFELLKKISKSLHASESIR